MYLTFLSLLVSNYVYPMIVLNGSFHYKIAPIQFKFRQ